MTTPSGLLDTNILIDILRGYPLAVNWLKANPTLALAIPSLVRMEMLLGAQNKPEQERVLKLMSPFPVIYPNDLDAMLAMSQFEIYHLSHQVEIIDCFIAALSVRFGLPVYTRNVKDLRVFPSVVLRVPY
jgi:predicted nucleic acid-binding protein